MAQYLGEIYVVYGLSFVLLGSSALLHPSDSEELPISRHFWLLGAFGLLHGGKEFLDAWMIVTNVAGVSIDWAGSSLLLLSYGALFEFARRTATDYGRERAVYWQPLTYAWIYIPVTLGVLLLAGIATDSAAGSSAGARYLLGFPGAVLAGLMLHRAFHTSKAMAHVLGIAFVAYGFLGGLITADINGFPAWLPTQAAFLQATGIPVELLRAGCALAAMLSLSVLVRKAAHETVVRARERANEIQDLANSLERRVAERTAELQESEGRLRIVMNNAADAMVTIDEHGLINTFNHAANLMFGYTPEEILGENVAVLMPEPHRSEHDQHIKKYLETGQARIIGIGLRELVAIRKDGTEFPIELSVAESQLDEHRIFVGSIRDIAERKERQQQLQQAQRLKVVGQLTGGVAHDFNNLLSVILGNLELLQDHISDNEESQALTEAAIRAGNRGADLTQRLLAFSRKQPLAPKPTDINKCVSNATELMRPTLGEGIAIETVLGGGLWNAMVDPVQLENAMLNLAINSRDAMPGGGKLTIETANSYLDHDYANKHSEVTPGQYVMITLSDTGCGMPPEVLEQVFEPFFTTKETGKGTGLGLSMVYGFVKQSGGHVAMHSEPGEGASVKLYLPRATEVEAGMYVPPVAEQSAMPRGDETILVVEDDPDVRTFVTSALGVLGYKIVEAADGPSALALMEQNPNIRLVFADVVLPGGMNGRELVEEIQKRHPNVKVLYTSGHTENAIVHHGRLDAGTQLLAKPYSRATLALRVRTILDG